MMICELYDVFIFIYSNGSPSFSLSSGSSGSSESSGISRFAIRFMTGTDTAFPASL